MKVTDDISIIVEELKAERSVGLPTETVYGLAARISSPKAIESIFRIKSRPFFDPLIVHLDTQARGETLAHWNSLARKLAHKFWPGPLTLVLPKTERVSSLITSGLLTVGLRCPRHLQARKVIETLDEALAAPSANRFKKTSPTTSAHVLSEFPNENLWVLEGGPCEVGLESTILEVLDEERVRLLRPGGISVSTIRETFPDIKWLERDRQTITAAGQLEDHYQPDVPFYLLTQEEFVSSKPFLDRVNPSHQKLLELQLAPEPELAARELYSELRRLSALKPAGIYFLRTSHHESEGWAAILDRLTRASQKSTSPS